MSSLPSDTDEGDELVLDDHCSSGRPATPPAGTGDPQRDHIARLLHDVSDDDRPRVTVFPFGMASRAGWVRLAPSAPLLYVDDYGATQAPALRAAANFALRAQHVLACQGPVWALVNGARTARVLDSDKWTDSNEWVDARMHWSAVLRHCLSRAPGVARLSGLSPQRLALL